jgi:3-dehydroquinate dehydratase / shikimate dehydrogenase
MRAAENEYNDGNTLLEFRLDHLDEPASGIQVIRAFRKKFADASILATCRDRRQHGAFNGAIDQQLAILRDAAEAGSTALDLEIESAERAESALPPLRERAALVVSYHDFEKTPALARILRRLQRIPADAYKIAVTARKPGDNLRVLEFAREPHSAPLILFAMSEMGAATRILAPSAGCPFTYAAPRNNSGTAPGQIAACSMRSLYRCDKLNRRTRLYGLIADPIAHSKSPLIHNRAFQSRRIDAVYLPFLVAPGQLSDWMKLAAALPVSGFSVTIPHKQRILSHLDSIEPLARRIGAVNTVWRKGGKWRGVNTDAEGVLKPLAQRMRIAHARILVAGYGGAARSAAIALADAGASVTITGRNLARAQSLARAARAEVVSLEAAQTCRFDALIHATPVGMSPNARESLFNGNIPAELIFDMVYNPHETLLLKRAKQQGCTVIHGCEMLIEQAARQFEIWTGESAPREAMRRAFEQQP